MNRRYLCSQRGGLWYAPENLVFGYGFLWWPNFPGRGRVSRLWLMGMNFGSAVTGIFKWDSGGLMTHSGMPIMQRGLLDSVGPTSLRVPE